MNPAAALFLPEALNGVSRALGRTDRIPESETFGCADRMYWHYRLIDFPNLRYQEAGLLVAMAYARDFAGNIFFRNSQVREWIGGIWRCWRARLNGDGSAAETYPNERSFCATAFSAASYMETLFLLEDDKMIVRELPDVEPTMQWLAANKNPDVANQMAASYAALAGFAALTGEPDHQAWADRRRDEFLGVTTDDGVFPEYGGFDAGYQSVTLSTLHAASTFAGAEDRLATTMRLGHERLIRALGDEESSGSPQNFRRTQYIFPTALRQGGAGAIEKLATDIERGKYLRPSWMDDRYCIGLATDFLRAGIEFGAAEPGPA